MFAMKSQNDSGLDEAIAQVLEEMKSLTADSAEYAKAVDQLDKLIKIKTHLEKNDRFSKDALLAVGGNLAGILLILNFERIGVITSKALGFVMKAKM